MTRHPLLWMVSFHVPYVRGSDILLFLKTKHRETAVRRSLVTSSWLMVSDDEDLHLFVGTFRHGRGAAALLLEAMLCPRWPRPLS